MGVRKVRGSGEPDERLTRIADAGVKAAAGHPEHAGELVIVIVSGGSEQGLAAHSSGEPDVDEVIAVLLANTEALCRAYGRPFSILRFGSN